MKKAPLRALRESASLCSTSVTSSASNILKSWEYLRVKRCRTCQDTDILTGQRRPEWFSKMRSWHMIYTVTHLKSIPWLHFKCLGSARKAAHKVITCKIMKEPSRFVMPELVPLFGATIGCDWSAELKQLLEEAAPQTSDRLFNLICHCSVLKAK